MKIYDSLPQTIQPSPLLSRRTPPMASSVSAPDVRFNGTNTAQPVVLREKTLAISTPVQQPKSSGWYKAGFHTLLVNLALLLSGAQAQSQPSKPEPPTVTAPQKLEQAPAPKPILERAPAPRIAPKSVALKVTPQEQKEMQCTTTALSMALKYLDVDVSPDQLDKDVKRPVKDSTSMAALVKTAKKYDRFAEVYNNAKFEDIVKHIDAGHPILVLVDFGDRGTHYQQTYSSFHMMIINGYSEVQEGKQIRRTVKVINPTPNKVTGKMEEEHEYERFCERYWSNISSAKSITRFNRRLNRNVTSYHQEPTGFNNMMIVLSKKNDLPKGGLEGEAAETDAAWARITEYLYDEQQKAEKRVTPIFP